MFSDQFNKLATVVGRTKLTTLAIVDVPCREIFLSLEFGSNFKREIMRYEVLEIPEFDSNTSRQNELNLFNRFDKTPTCNGRTDKQGWWFSGGAGGDASP